MVYTRFDFLLLPSLSQNPNKIPILCRHIFEVSLNLKLLCPFSSSSLIIHIQKPNYWTAVSLKLDFLNCIPVMLLDTSCLLYFLWTAFSSKGCDQIQVHWFSKNQSVSHKQSLVVPFLHSYSFPLLYENKCKLYL